jgi:hypothetical protein
MKYDFVEKHVELLKLTTQMKRRHAKSRQLMRMRVACNTLPREFI